jgi:hypothetical protein
LKRENDLNAAIISILLEINSKHPELSNFLNEMPDTIPDAKNPHITIKILEDYYQSLNQLLNEYEIIHPSKALLDNVIAHHPNRFIL